MAFICTVKGENFNIEVFRKGNAFSVVINLGYEDDSDAGYSAVIGLEPMGGGNIEFFFHLVRFRDGHDDELFWSGLDLPNCILPNDRECILDALCSTAHELLNQVKPPTFHYCTHDRDAPDKALVKHILMMKVFESCGYTVNSADPYQGKRVWWMERKSDV